jgi:hypothetical protein
VSLGVVSCSDLIVIQVAATVGNTTEGSGDVGRYVQRADGNPAVAGP